MIEFQPLSDSGHQHFAKKLFETAFPYEERPSFSVAENRDQDNFHFLVITLDGEEPIGIFTYWTFETFTYIEHFAIGKEYRGKGLGRASFLDFMVQHPDQIVLEIEMPDNEVAERRLEFYSDMGFVRNAQDYMQPSYHKRELVLPMLIMSKYELSDDDFEDVKRILYREVYHYAPKN